MHRFWTPALLAAAFFAGLILASTLNAHPSGVDVSFRPTSERTLVAASRGWTFRMTEGGALQVGSPIHDKRELEAVLNAAEWPPSLHPEALRIAGCESGWDPHAIGSQGEVGLFQIHGVHAWRVPPQGDLLKNVKD